MVLAAGERRRRVSGPLGGILRAKSMAGEAGQTPFKSHEKRGSWGACRADGRHLNYLSGERQCLDFYKYQKRFEGAIQSAREENARNESPQF